MDKTILNERLSTLLLFQHILTNLATLNGVVFQKF